MGKLKKSRKKLWKLENEKKRRKFLGKCVLLWCRIFKNKMASSADLNKIRSHEAWPATKHSRRQRLFKCPVPEGRWAWWRLLSRVTDLHDEFSSHFIDKRNILSFSRCVLKVYHIFLTFTWNRLSHKRADA